MTTVSAKASEIQREWFVIDVEDIVLGRAASETSKIILGKHKPTYTPHVDCGDNVIIINAEKVALKGNKLEGKKYYRHTGHPGGIKEETPASIFSGKRPEKVFEKAVERMIPRNKLGRKKIKKLFVYAGPEHPHAAQNPKEIKLEDQNPKNKKIR